MVPNIAKKEEGEKFSSKDGQGLPNSLTDVDEESIEAGRLINELVNYSVSFTPDLTFEKLVQDYKLAEKLFGPRLIQAITGYDPRYLKKNIKLPEFQRKLKKEMEEKFEDLKEKKLLNKSGHVTDKGEKLSSLILYTEELNHLKTKGLGEKDSKKKSVYGDLKDVRDYKRQDSYRDISMGHSIKTAIRRNHDRIRIRDLKSKDMHSKGRIDIVYCLDTSGSMRGKKLEWAKKAGIALMYKAINNKDKVGLIIFESKVSSKIEPTSDFNYLLEKIAGARAKNETNIKNALLEAASLFQGNSTKHIILLSDAMPTVGKKEDVLEAVSIARNQNITISLVGIDLGDGEELAKKIVELGGGRLYLVKNLEELDAIMLEEYQYIA